MIEEPILIDWDSDGRLWVIEQRGTCRTCPRRTNAQPIGRISVLEDTNGDGKMDKKTVFMDGLVLPRALKVLDHGVLIGEPPHLWLARDTNGDLKADTKELVVDTYGTEMGNIEHNANSLTWALDNWMYTSEHNGYLRLKDGKFEYQQTLSRGQWGATQDDAGRIYRNTNEAALFVDLLPARYFMRNPNLLRTRGSYESLQNDEVNTVWPVRPTRGVNRGYQDGILRARRHGSRASRRCVRRPSTAATGCQPSCTATSSSPSPRPISSAGSIVSDDGTTLRAKKAYDGAEFLASTDERFRPVYLSTRPTARSTSSTRITASSSTRDSSPSTCATRFCRASSISRVVTAGSIGSCTTRRRGTRRRRCRRRRPRSSSTMLSHPNGWWRDTAQRLLVERGDRVGRPGAEGPGREVRPTGARACTRYGRSTVSTRSNRRR